MDWAGWLAVIDGTYYPYLPPDHARTCKDTTPEISFYNSPELQSKLAYSRILLQLSILVECLGVYGTQLFVLLLMDPSKPTCCGSTDDSVLSNAIRFSGSKTPMIHTLWFRITGGYHPVKSLLPPQARRNTLMGSTVLNLASRGFPASLRLIMLYNTHQIGRSGP